MANRFSISKSADNDLIIEIDTTLIVGSISDYIASFFVKKTLTQTTYDINKTNASGSLGITLTEPNIATVHLLSSDLTSLSQGSYYWSLQIASGSVLETQPAAPGDIILLPTVV